MKVRPYFSMLLALVFCLNKGIAQTDTVPTDVAQDQAVNFTNDTLWRTMHDLLPLVGHTISAETVECQQFNEGIISDPLLLVQGKMAGVQIYNRGGNPNTQSLFRVRGTFSSNQRFPLVVIDGFTGASLEGIDPADIASITVLKDGAAQALFGFRGMNGVILINTKTGETARGPLQVHYSGQAGGSVAYEGIPVLDADAYRAAGGRDFGSSTNWRDEILRSGLSHVHNLSLQGGDGRSFYRISGNYRNVQGVLRKSGFEQLNTRIDIATSLLNDKLRLRVSAAKTGRKSEFGFQEAFYYATSYNPTAPVFGQDNNVPLDPATFRGYFESPGAFDSYNPRAIVDLNERFGEALTLNTAAHLSYEAGEYWTFNARYRYEDQFHNERTFYSPQAYFGGNVFNADKGSADLYDREDQSSLYEFNVQYQQHFKGSHLVFMAGTAHQKTELQSLFVSADGFSNDLVVRTRHIQRMSSGLPVLITIPTGGLNFFSQSLDKYLQSYYGLAQFGVQDKLFLHASLRQDRFGKVGAKALFPGAGLTLDLGHPLGVDAFKVRLNYGQSSGSPEDGIVSTGQNSITIVNSTGNTQIVNLGTPPGIERKAEWSLGLDIEKGSVQLSLELYTSQLKDWGFENADAQSEDIIYRIPAALRTRGVELGLDATLYQSGSCKYQNGLLLSAYRSYWQGDLGGAYISTNPMIWAESGSRAGELYGPVFSGELDAYGYQVFEDLNADGRINIFTLYNDPEKDLARLGNGLPSLEMGWQHQLVMGSWEIHALFRGAFGHSLVNQARQYWEPHRAGLNYNYVQTELTVEGIQQAQYSNLYVEKADFVKLDYLSLVKTFPLGKTHDSRKIRLSATAQNLLLLSSYTGPDPEPALTGYANFSTYQLAVNFQNNRYAAGIDNHASYLPAKSFVFGVSMIF